MQAVQEQARGKYQGVYLASQPTLEKAKLELLGNLERVEKYLTLISGSVGWLGEEWMLERLQTWQEELRQDISESIKEVEIAFSERSVLKGKYSLPLIFYREGNLTLFSYCQFSQKARDLQDFLFTLRPPSPPQVPYSAAESFLTSEERCTPASSLLPTFSDSHLCFYDFRQRKPGHLIPLQRRLNIDSFSLYAVVHQRRVFASGGRSHSAYLVHGDGQVEVCPSMNWKHSVGGIVVWQSAICLFGSDQRGVECERMSLSLSHWTQLPSMNQARSHFSPTVWCSAVYLCGGLGNDTVEVFNSVSFQLLYLRLPSKKPCLSLVIGGKLMLFTDSYRMVLTKSSDQAWPMVRARAGGEMCRCWSAGPVQCYGRLYVWAAVTGVSSFPIDGDLW